MTRLAVPLALALIASGFALAQDRLPPGSRIADQEPLPRLHLNLVTRGGEEKNAFLVAYGHALFKSPEILGETARAIGMSCATCHNNGDANRDLFVAGLSVRKGGLDVTGKFFHATADNGVFDPLDIPSLRGVRFTAPYGRDGRIASLREFVAMVTVTEFGGAEPTSQMLDALTAFLNQLDFLPTPFLHRNGRLAANAPEAAKRGEVLAQKHCASCHDPASYFVDGKRHDVGSGGGFDTPTLLGIVHTPPYMHDGSLATLSDVVAFFDKSFGLDLAANEKADLATYLEAVGTGEDPYQRTPIDERAIFTSTLDLLIARRDRFHTMLLLRGLAAPELDRIGEAVLAEDWDVAKNRLEEYRAAKRN
jgi:cytochrome c peroxidase